MSYWTEIKNPTQEQLDNAFIESIIGLTDHDKLSYGEGVDRDLGAYITTSNNSVLLVAYKCSRKLVLSVGLLTVTVYGTCSMFEKLFNAKAQVGVRKMDATIDSIKKQFLGATTAEVL